MQCQVKTSDLTLFNLPTFSLTYNTIYFAFQDTLSPASVPQLPSVSFRLPNLQRLRQNQLFISFNSVNTGCSKSCFTHGNIQCSYSSASIARLSQTRNTYGLLRNFDDTPRRQTRHFFWICRKFFVQVFKTSAVGRTHED